MIPSQDSNDPNLFTARASQFYFAMSTNTRPLTTADYEMKAEGIRVTVHTMG